MDHFLLTLFYFARPIMFIEAGVRFGDFNFFELVTMLFSAVLAVVALVNVIAGRSQSTSGTEWFVFAFVLWCSVVGFLYPQEADFKAYVKFVLPLATFVILRRALSGRSQYVGLLGWQIMGFALPVTLSTLLIYRGESLAQKIYWTGLERYHGAYLEVHTMGHNMGFLIMLAAVYVVMKKATDARAAPLGVHRWVGLSMLGILALYCLYNGQVRTVYAGLLVFFGLALLAYSRKALLILGGLLLASVLVFGALYKTVFFDVVQVAKGEKGLESAGSGRPSIWRHNLTIYESLPFDRQMGGVGVGNFVTGQGEQFLRDKISIDNVWSSHNDYLDVLMQTGAVGFVLFALMQLSLLRSILLLPGRERYVFLALFCAVALMNLLSNSYITRFGLGQMFYMVMAYAELRHEPRTATARAPRPLRVAA
jgi:O-antigen ligase